MKNAIIDLLCILVFIFIVFAGLNMIEDVVLSPPENKIINQVKDNSIPGDMLLVVKTIALESANQPFAGQVAVASVIKTRIKERGLTAKQVVLQPKQFSCFPISRELTLSELDTAYSAWKLAKAGRFNHYAHTSINNYWTKKAKSKKTIKDHVFYKL